MADNTRSPRVCLHMTTQCNKHLVFTILYLVYSNVRDNIRIIHIRLHKRLLE